MCSRVIGPCDVESFGFNVWFLRILLIFTDVVALIESRSKSTTIVRTTKEKVDLYVECNEEVEVLGNAKLDDCLRVIAEVITANEIAAQADIICDNNVMFT
ncbi:hypothetical protein RMATCC62417_13767 [Rhizopus microsporus]|nr:hypothetical protein RMATCC62417_13767 [Rhizopus microsporus]